LLQQETLSPRGVEMIRIIQRNLKQEARAIEELVSLVELLINRQPAVWAAKATNRYGVRKILPV
jgi:hypothetical protein